ncbi:replication protein A1-like protein, partial [Trifolium medium]|nr:replication protein A1-like protein [Trifolium medium]
MNPTATCTRCGLQDESFLHCIRECEFSRSLWNHIDFKILDFFSNLVVCDWLKLSSMLSSSRLVSGGLGDTTI